MNPLTQTLKVTTPNDREILMTRDFSAPRTMVWKAMTEPDLIRRWLFGPPGWEMTVCREDQRAGGTFHWEWKSPDGQLMTMKGDYREVQAPEKAVRTERFYFGSDTSMGEQLATMTLTEQGGITHLAVKLEYASKEARDGALGSGMEQGVTISYDRLAELLAA